MRKINGRYVTASLFMAKDYDKMLEHRKQYPASIIVKKSTQLGIMYEVRYIPIEEKSPYSDI